MPSSSEVLSKRNVADRKDMNEKMWTFEFVLVTWHLAFFHVIVITPLSSTFETAVTKARKN